MFMCFRKLSSVINLMNSGQLFSKTELSSLKNQNFCTFFIANEFKQSNVIVGKMPVSKMSLLSKLEALIKSTFCTFISSWFPGIWSTTN